MMNSTLTKYLNCSRNVLFTFLNFIWQFILVELSFFYKEEEANEKVSRFRRWLFL